MLHTNTVPHSFNFFIKTEKCQQTFTEKYLVGFFTTDVWAKMLLSFRQQKLNQSSSLSHYLSSAPSPFPYFKATQKMKLFQTDNEIPAVCFVSLCLLTVF